MNDSSSKDSSKNDKPTANFPTNKPISDNFSMFDLEQALLAFMNETQSLHEKCQAKVIGFDDVPQLITPLIEQLNHIASECISASSREVQKENRRKKREEEDTIGGNVNLSTFNKKPVERQESNLAKKLLQSRGQVKHGTFTEKAFVDANPFDDLSLKFASDSIIPVAAEEFVITFPSNPPGFFVERSSTGKGAVVESILNQAAKKQGLMEKMAISKVGHVECLTLSVHEIHSLISSAQYPLEITFVKPEDFARLARDPFEGILDDIPYPNKDGTNSVSDMSFEDEVGKVNPKTKLPSHESFIECGNAVCRKKLRGGRWCLIRINIDNMKILCERYGDRAGDTTVQKMASNIHSQVKKHIPHSLFFHIWQDDFAIIAPCADEDWIFKKMDGIRTKISKTYVAFDIIDHESPRLSPIEIARNKKKRKRIKLSITCGLSTLNPGMRFNQWKKACEKALEKGKKEGRNRIVRVSRSQMSSNKWSKELYTNLQKFIPMNNEDYLIRMTQRLLKNGASLDFQEPPDKKTPLMLALQNTEKNLVNELLKHDFDANLQCTQGKTTLMYALEYNWEDEVIVNLLQRPWEPATIDTMGNTALSIAMDKSREQVVASIIRLQGNRVSAEQLERHPELKNQKM